MTDHHNRLLPGQLVQFIKADPAIRVAVLNGSRANPRAPRDFLQDWDVAVFLRDFSARDYRTNREWVHQFGNLVICQQNDAEDGSYIFLMQFDSGLRIDLDFFPLHMLPDRLAGDSLSRVLFDPDGLTGQPPPPEDTSYRTPMPDRLAWNATLNELWWLQPSVARELWRGNLPLARRLWDVYLRDALLLLASWHAASRHNWQINPGKAGAWLGTFLEPDVYAAWMDLYCGPDPHEQWHKLLALGPFVDRLGIPLARSLGYDYPLEESRLVPAYLHRIKNLPPGAPGFSDFSPSPR